MAVLADLSLLLWGSRLVASPRIRIMERKTHRPDRYHRSHVRTSVDTQLIRLTARMDGDQQQPLDIRSSSLRGVVMQV
jgi:hypothetical protein